MIVLSTQYLGEFFWLERKNNNIIMLHEIIRQTRTTMKEMRNKKSHNIAKLKTCHNYYTTFNSYYLYWWLKVFIQQSLVDWITKQDLPMVSYEKLSRERKCVCIHNGIFFLAINSEVIHLQERGYPGVITLHDSSHVQ